MCEMQMMIHVQKKTATLLLVATNSDCSVAYDVSQRHPYKQLHKQQLAAFQRLTTHLRMLAAMKMIDLL